MDANGARQLAARIKAGVSAGMRVELVSANEDSRLVAGDRGVVEAVDEEGMVLVKWDRGLTLAIDPSLTPVRRLVSPAAPSAEA
jgi:uncharacterized protein DUF4314